MTTNAQLSQDKTIKLNFNQITFSTKNISKHKPYGKINHIDVVKKI